MTVSPLLDIAAFIWCLVCWIGYTQFADHSHWRSESAMAAMDAYRTRWMKRMIERAPRIEDIQIIGNLMRSVSFFASTAIFVLAGLVAVLGAADRAHEVISGLPFTVRTTPGMWQLKVLFLIVIFVYAFFKFTWSLRQFNYLSIMVGGAPAPGDDNPDDADYADRAARVSVTAATHFNRGIRAYYFGLATLSWFVHPWLFISLSAWVVLVLYRREFRSRILRALGLPDSRAWP